MFFKTKKSREIYDLIIAHRGLHTKFPENTIKAYESALEKGYAIELDIRFTRDEKIVCFHDRYTKRLLGISGTASHKTYKELSGYFVKKTNEKIPLLSDVLKLVDGKVALLIEVKGILTKRFQEKLLEILKEYKGVIYFHAKNMITYIRLGRLFNDRTFYILDPLRKRFNFIKSK